MNAWTPQERNRAIQWRNHGKTYGDIAKRLGRSLHSVVSLLESTARYKFRAVMSERKCLCCGTAFMSQGPHNRICQPCRYASRDTQPLELTAGDGCSRAGAGRRG